MTEEPKWIKCQAEMTVEGSIVKIQCQHYHNEGEECKGHSCDGYTWKDGDERPRPRNWRINGLWLTSGCRVVKPGAGESCSEPWDIKLMTAKELQDGIKMDIFLERLANAMQVRDESMADRIPECRKCGKSLFDSQTEFKETGTNVCPMCRDINLMGWNTPGGLRRQPVKCHPIIYDVTRYHFKAFINGKSVSFPFSSKKKMHIAMDRIASGMTDPNQILHGLQ